MGKYSKREFQLGEWWLGQREGSPAWYAFRYDECKRRTERVSLGTDSLERAKEKLTELYLQTRVVRDEKPGDAPLADVLRRYWDGHAKNLRSASSNRDCINRWLDFWGTAYVGELTDVARQEAFHKFMRERGYQSTTMMRTISIGKAALNRAVARHELMSAPHLLSVRVGDRPPMGRPLSVDEAKAIYAHAAEHVQSFMRWALGTAARPEAVLELHSRQVDHGLPHLAARLLHDRQYPLHQHLRLLRERRLDVLL